MVVAARDASAVGVRVSGAVGTRVPVPPARVDICGSAARLHVVEHHRLAVARRLRQPHVARDTVWKTFSWKNSRTSRATCCQVRALVVHREEDAVDVERGVERPPPAEASRPSAARPSRAKYSPAAGRPRRRRRPARSASAGPATGGQSMKMRSYRPRAARGAAEAVWRSGSDQLDLGAGEVASAGTANSW